MGFLNRFKVERVDGTQARLKHVMTTGQQSWILLWKGWMGLRRD